jgi:hypothetical protein
MTAGEPWANLDEPWVPDFFGFLPKSGELGIVGKALTTEQKPHFSQKG